MDAEASDRRAANIKEDENVGRPFETLAQQGAQGFRGVRPEKTKSRLPSFAAKPHIG
jgi:nitrogen regulatory protein PII-like uncharacterized protein